MFEFANSAGVEVPWRRGYAEDCKSLYTGSNPVGTSKPFQLYTPILSHAPERQETFASGLGFLLALGAGVQLQP